MEAFESLTKRRNSVDPRLSHAGYYATLAGVPVGLVVSISAKDNDADPNGFLVWGAFMTNADRVPVWSNLGYVDHRGRTMEA